jgi:hypothetical protein
MHHQSILLKQQVQIRLGREEIVVPIAVIGGERKVQDDPSDYVRI